MKHLIAVALAATLISCGQSQSPQGEFPKGAPGVIGKVANSAEQIGTPTEHQRETFGTLSQYVGTTFKGAPTGESTETFVDIQKWEWGLGGNTILIRHALEDGSYGGDTHVYKSAKTGNLTYVYVTSGGFHTVGEMTPLENGWVAEEAVDGHESITRVRSTSTIDEEGVWTMNSDYLTDGEWVPGHAFEYLETDAPLPMLKVK